MRRYILGDNEAFRLLYARHSGRVYAYLRKKLDSPQETDEVFQACFLKFHQARDQYNPKYPILQWLYVISRTTLLDHVRKEGRQVQIADGVAPEDLPLSQKDNSGSLRE